MISFGGFLKQIRQVSQSRRTDIAVLMSVPCVFAIINSNWIYSIIGWLDSWYYVGYGLNYSDPQFLNDNYKISRLPWILIEFAVRQTFNPVVSSWILQLGCLLTTAAALYLALSRVFDRFPAFLGTLVFIANPFVYASGGADYQTSCSGAFYALTWLWLARTGEFGFSPARLFIAGALGAATIHSNILFINFVPLLLGYYIVAYKNSHEAWPPLARSAGFAASGAILFTAALCLVNWAVGRSPFFFMPQFKIVSSYVADSSHEKYWWHSWSSGWFLTARYIWPFAAAYIVSLILLVTRIPKVVDIKSKRSLLMYVGAHVFACTLWIFWQTMGHTALDWSYFAYPLAFPLAGAVSGIASLAFPKRDQQDPSLLSKFGMATLFLAPFCLYQFGFQTINKPWSGLVSFIAIALALPLLSLSASRFMVWPSVALMSIGIFCSVERSKLFDRSELFVFDTCPYERLGATAIDEAHRILRSQAYPHAKVTLWADQDEKIEVGHGCTGSFKTMKLGEFEPSLVSTGFSYLQPYWEAKYQNELQDQRLAAVANQGSLIAYVTNDPHRVTNLIRRFVHEGAVATQPRKVTLSSLPISMYLFEVKAKKLDTPIPR